MHPALMAQYDSAMGIFQERVGWRCASTMPGVQCVMMGGTMLMLQQSADCWDTTQLVCVCLFSFSNNECDCIFVFWFVQVMLLVMPPLAKAVVQFSWSMCSAVDLKRTSCIVITTVQGIPHAATMKMLELYAKVGCIIMAQVMLPRYSFMCYSVQTFLFAYKS